MCTLTFQVNCICYICLFFFLSLYFSLSLSLSLSFFLFLNSDLVLMLLSFLFCYDYYDCNGRSFRWDLKRQSCGGQGQQLTRNASQLFWTISFSLLELLILDWWATIPHVSYFLFARWGKFFNALFFHCTRAPDHVSISSESNKLENEAPLCIFISPGVWNNRRVETSLKQMQNVHFIWF